MTRVFGKTKGGSRKGVSPEAERDAEIDAKLRQMIALLAGTGNGDGDNAIHVDTLSELLDDPFAFRVDSVLR